MLDPLDFENRPLIEKLQRKRWRSGLVIFFERLTIHFWRPALWLIFFCGLWLFQVPAIFGSVVPTLISLTFFIGFFYLIYKDSLSFRPPSEKDIDRRMENESGIAHRPLSSFKDILANPEKPSARSLWRINKNKMQTLLSGLRPAQMRPVLSEKDPYALRFGIFVFFITGLIVAGPEWNERLWHGVKPLDLSGKDSSAHDITIWITPPEYTKLAQITLQDDKDKNTLEIPQGSLLKIRTRAILGRPHLEIGQRRWEMEKDDDESYALETEIPEGENISIRQILLTRASWNYKLIPDTAPFISSTQDYEILPGGPMRFPLNLHDDYGVQYLSMDMNLDEMVTDAPLGEPVTETRSIMSPAKTELEIGPVYDLTSHPWAGLPVTITFTAEDHLGQRATTEPVKLTLPEREFEHPIAKKLIAYRKQLAWAPLDGYREMALETENILMHPHEFQHDLIVFLNIRSLASHLFYAAPSQETTRMIMAQLWDTALRIEDGNLTLAARNLRDAQMALENALKNPNITDQETARLMQELRKAMSEYMMELQREMQKRMAEGKEMPMIPPEMLSKMLSPDALSSFLDQMESQMLSGDKQGAQEMLSELQQMMDMLDPSIASPMPPDMQMMADGVNELQELIDRQEELLRQTENQVEILITLKSISKSYSGQIQPDPRIMEQLGLEDMPPPPQPEELAPPIPVIDTRENKVEQEALRYILGQLMIEAGGVLDNIPENLGLAEQEMRGSSGALEKNEPAESIPHQEKAIEHLKEAQEQLSQQFMARMQQMTGMMLSGSGMRYDPLGRPYGGHGNQNGMFPGSRVEIPDEAERKQAEEILRLLRRRSGELGRPETELEYYRRLLKLF